MQQAKLSVNVVVSFTAFSLGSLRNLSFCRVVLLVQLSSHLVLDEKRDDLVVPTHNSSMRVARDSMPQDKKRDWTRLTFRLGMVTTSSRE